MVDPARVGAMTRLAMVAVVLMAGTSRAEPEAQPDIGSNVVSPNLIPLVLNEVVLEYERVVTPHLALFGEDVYLFGRPRARPGVETMGRVGYGVGPGLRWFIHGTAPTGWFVGVGGQYLHMSFDDGTGGSGYGVTLQGGYAARLNRWLGVTAAFGAHAAFGDVNATETQTRPTFTPAARLSVDVLLPGREPLSGGEPLERALERTEIDEPSERRWFVAQDVAFWTHVGAQYLHLADHYLRQHEPGWPLASQFTSMSLFGLVITPSRIAAQLAGAGPALWIPLDSVQLVLLVLTHRGGGLDSPHGIYESHVDGPNELGTSSRSMG
jgi:hypothetical protein